ncbi:leucine-rich repeat-containing protein 15-like [Leguminivora glycinivorella]|uniref:leucine-rich repeat-containing protein 15-like n=1 Tax=Leguminivora glycinivorella TaxID=1035111 RepID=UPI00200D6C34|nr:leucine-rich repeat-containing protein 15-like [Leguminivora glycinivorella]XP_047987453.1 leucine-rich repeat-containing protein 15-like [Leguminivora glycinivorella]
MNIRDAVRVVALLALATCVTTEMCPATTRVPVTCSLQSGTEIELSWSIREYITVECLDNGTFSCAELPKLSIPVLPTRVMIDNCVLPTYESLSCTFQVLGASGATLLTLRGPHSFLKPEHVQGLHLSTLNLKGSTFDEPYTPLELPTSALAALSSLQKLVVTNARLNLSPDSLAGVSQLKHLELSSSDITGLNQSVFRELKSLLTLSLWGNDLRELQSGTFDGLQSLQSLELFDPLQSLDEGVFAAAENLRELRLENIELDELSQAALRDLNELE